HDEATGSAVPAPDTGADAARPQLALAGGTNTDISVHLRSRSSTRLRAHFAEWGTVWAIALASRIGVLVVGLLATYAAQSRGITNYLPIAKSATFIHYQDVIVHGYNLKNATEYPLLPGLMYTLNQVGVPLAVGALLVVNICFLAGIICFAMLGARYVGKKTAVIAAAYLCVFPTSHFFSLASTESLMLVGMCGATLAALHKGGTTRGWLIATPLAMMCALSRPPGALVGIVLLAIAVMQLRSKIAPLRGRALAAALVCGASIPASVLGFFYYMKQVTGDALAPIHAQAQFGRSMSVMGPIDAVTGSIASVRGGSLGEGFELAAAFLIAAMLVWFAVRAVGDRYEIAGWTAFGAASLLMPLATGIVWQMPRFMLLVPPVFWMLAKVGERRPWVHNALMILLPMALAFKVVFEVVGVSQ
ncbi:MAG: glycosyltransferase family 39 protein, partial [Thermoleophilia bacterium]|nr:glycosyltransferase family 39 protein [Thermoleophilia bacterium]